jgi:hypothetical protein
MTPSPNDARSQPSAAPPAQAVARPVSALERAWRWCRRYPAGAWLLALGVLLLGAVCSSVAAVRFSADRQVAETARLEALGAERDLTEKLWQSYLDQAQAGRLSRQAGQRFDSLEAVERAARIRPDLRLRNEAIACLALADLRPAPGKGFPTGAQSLPVSSRAADDVAHRRRARIRGTSVLVASPDSGPVVQLEHGVPVEGVLFSPDGRLLATASHLSVCLWHMPTGRLHCELEHPCGAYRMEFNHAGDLLLTHAFDGASRLWDCGSGRLLVRTGDGVVFGPFSPDDRLLRGYRTPWELARGDECRVLQHGGRGSRRDSAALMQGPWAAAFSLDGHLVATAGLDGVRLWEVRTGRHLAVLPDSGAGFAVFGRDDSLLVGGGTPARPGGALWRWPMQYKGDTVHLGPPQKVRTMTLFRPGTPSRPTAVMDDAGRALVSEPGRDRALLFDTDLAKPPLVLPGEAGTSFVALSRDGQYLAASPGPVDRPVRVNVWDGSGHKVDDLGVERGGHVAFTPDGRWLVVGSSHSYHFFRAGTWRPGLVIPRQSNRPGPLAFSPDGKLLAIAASNHTVKLVDPALGGELATLTPAQQKIVSGLAFSPDGARLAVVTENDSVFLWDLRAVWKKLDEMGLAGDLPALPPDAQSRPGGPRRAVVHPGDAPAVSVPVERPLAATPAELERFTTFVTLSLRRASAEDAARDLASRLGIGLSVLPRVTVDEGPARPVDLRLDQVPAWEALHRLEEAAGLVDAPGDSTTLQLRAGKLPPPGTTAVRGPFRISVASLTYINGLLPRDGAMQRSQRLSLVVGVQTMPHPDLLRLADLRIDEVEDDRGKIDPPLVTSRLGPRGGERATPSLQVRTFFARFPPPTRAGAQWKKVRGALSVVVSTRREELVRAPDLARAAGRTWTGPDGVRLHIRQVLRQGSLWHVDLAITGDRPGALIEGRFRIEVRDAAGKPCLPIDGNAPLPAAPAPLSAALAVLAATPGPGFPSRLPLALLAAGRLPGSEARSGVRTFAAPAGHRLPLSLSLVRFEPRTLDVPFEFRDLPLP